MRGTKNRTCDSNKPEHFGTDNKNTFCTKNTTQNILDDNVFGTESYNISTYLNNSVEKAPTSLVIKISQIILAHKVRIDHMIQIKQEILKWKIKIISALKS